MDTTYSFASLSMPFGPWGAAAFSDAMQLSGKFQERSEFNTVTGNNKSIMKNAAFVSYAYPFYGIVSAGARVKFLQERVFSTSGDAFGLDFSLYGRPLYGLSFGLTVNNINRPKITLIEDPDVYGRNTRFGVAYHGNKERYLITIDVNKLENQNAFFTTGVEVNPLSLLSLRAGLNQQDQVTAGVGINVWPFKFDYAFSNQEQLGACSKVSITYRWGNIYQTMIDPQSKNKINNSILLDGLYNEIRFVATVPDVMVKQWELTIYNDNHKKIRTLRAEKRPPDQILWDLMDDMKQPAGRGAYRYQFTVEYFNGKTWQNNGKFQLDYNDAKQGEVEIRINGSAGEINTIKADEQKEIQKQEQKQ
jgi:hypothetical protein